jgi:diguanylate cyclase (GGDEF)-like protein
MKNGPVDLSTSSLLAGPLGGQSNGSVQLSEDRYSIIRRLKAPVWIFDIDKSRIVFANGPAFALWRAKDEHDLCSRDLTQNMSPAVSRRLKQYQIDFVEQDSFFTEQWTLYPNDKPTSVMVVFSGIWLDDGRMGMQCEVVDQSANEPDNIRSAEALLHTDVMITLYSIEGNLLYMNPAARKAAISSQHAFSDIFVNSADYENVMTAVQGHGEHRLVARAFTGVGARWYDISVKRCADAVTGNPAVLITAIDVSELKVARDKARYLADRDQLTGSYNRTYIQQHFETLTSAQSGKCALLYFDVDKFKKINDELGHEMGDIVLKQLASRARKLIRSEDLLARLGGDEFVILLHEVPSSEVLAHKVNDLQRSFGQPIRHAATHVNVTVSIGVTTFEPQETEFDTVLRNADIALYISKQGGRDQATFFNDELGAIDKERRLIETEIKRGIEENEFVLYYQPRVDLRSGKTVSVEALVRWMHPDQGLIMPDKFIPICEETGMIEDLGELVLKMGCRQALEWARNGVDIGVSINISPRQFLGNRLIDALKEFARTPDFPRRKVELEITENVLFGDHRQIAEKLQDIAELGYKIAIDDFGTGYSNLSYISRFPLNCIKIDKSFVSQLPESGPIIQLILTLAKQVGATAVAEGVETQAEYDWLFSEGCDQVQGYYFSRPVPLQDLQPSLANCRIPLS